MGTTLGLVTWTVRMTLTSINGRLSLKEAMFIEIRWNVGCLGFALEVAGTLPELHRQIWSHISGGGGVTYLAVEGGARLEVVGDARPEVQGDGGEATAKLTTKLLRWVISQQRLPNTNQAGALIHAIRAIGEQLTVANPVAFFWAGNEDASLDFDVTALDEDDDEASDSCTGR
ncbi:hypothetical protein L1987_08910 [Smallanthus sonchifolius]|uniref:Uncharacterized protein n=1 Tax=Smallanthus sonchifolius TaxID=185202 RepID=A0ACB9JMG3_9ASTR|nr:hypothetical protein L1987_08910 [Smallanthus sonchifolius]